MQNRRKAFYKLCPNAMPDLSNRLSKKQSKTEKKLHKNIFAHTGPVTIYVDPPSSAVDSALATIDWQDLVDCNSVIQQDAAGGAITQQQDHCLSGEPDFDLQEFRDAVDQFIADQPSLMQPSLGPPEFQLPACNVPVFEPCMTNPLQAQPEHLLPINVQTIPSTEQYWRDVADHNQKALGDALVENNQLQVSLTEKQEEIVSLKEKNIQLNELANQAKHLSSVLDKLMKERTKQNSGATQGRLPVKRSLEDFYPQSNEPDSTQVDEILREISKKCNIALMGSDLSERKRPRLEPMDSMDWQEEGVTEIKMCGAFHGLKTSTGLNSVNLGDTDLEDVSFRTSIKEHSTIRTLAFPQGNAFTIRTSGGGYKFRWVPN
uniref:Multicilin n=2 Tax=Xenopus laevis TaxID=8355 RepID=MCIN_XENLA|nr:RecName: Full=Multicilin; AltName: Full=Multiciliate differentiation and DNA synthesis-associated cell cycle protein; Short=McIdas protein; AltName: Full=Protein Idas [Xenopus laevis]